MVKTTWAVGQGLSSSCCCTADPLSQPSFHPQLHSLWHSPFPICMGLYRTKNLGWSYPLPLFNMCRVPEVFPMLQERHSAQQDPGSHLLVTSLCRHSWTTPVLRQWGVKECHLKRSHCIQRCHCCPAWTRVVCRKLLRAALCPSSRMQKDPF